MRFNLFLILLISVSVRSQNLVLNPSFEEVEKCIHRVSQFQQNVKHWTIPTNGTTDLHNSCSTGETGVPANFSGFQESEFGKNYAGCYFYSGKDYREYIQGTLIHPLEQGKRYRVSMYLSLADYSNMAIQEIGFYMSKQKIKVDVEHILPPKKLLTQHDSSQLKTIRSNGFFDDKKNWTLASIEFIANGGEQFITIGNFTANSATKKKQVIRGDARNDTSYYYLDMVSVELLPDAQISDIAVESSPIEQFDELSNVFKQQVIEFEFDRSELGQSGLNVAQKLADYMNENSAFKIKILGHTDEIGAMKYNQILSIRRAESLANYLINQGILTDRIQIIGHGSSQPISKINNFEGRQRNRRVEFEIIKMDQ